MCLSWDSDSKSTLRVSPFRTWWCLLFFILGYECHAFLISRSGPSFPTLGKYLGTSFSQLTLVLSVYFRRLATFRFVSCVGWSSRNFRVSSLGGPFGIIVGVNGWMGCFDLIYCSNEFLQVCRLDAVLSIFGAITDFHSIILPKHPFVRFHCTYQYLSNIDTFRWIWMAGRFDGQI